jgi:hypothetical protein
MIASTTYLADDSMGLGRDSLVNGGFSHGDFIYRGEEREGNGMRTCGGAL